MSKRNLIVLFALALFTLPATAGPVVYVIGGSQQFGTLNLASGAFQQIGPNVVEGSDGLVPGPNGSLLTLSFGGNLVSINPATGASSIIGPTGLDDCTAPGSPCGPTSAAILAGLAGTLYATDVSNNLYTVDATTGAATLIGPTGIPPLPFALLATNPDGSFNAFDETLFTAGGSLYATFDAITINFAPFAITPVIPANLYQIDPSTALATLIGPTALNLSAATTVAGTTYAFNAATQQVVTLDLTNGSTSFVSNIDPAAGLLGGASEVPEPASMALAGIGIALIVASTRQRLRASSQQS